jgi:hypothetical protein
MKSKIIISVAAIALIATMIPLAFADGCEPCEPCTSGLSPGFWKHNIGVYLTVAKGAYSSPYDGFDKTTMPAFLEGLGIDLQEAYDVLTTRGGGIIAQARLDMANDLNTAAGFGIYVD